MIFDVGPTLEERLGTLFQSDTLLPAQFLAVFSNRSNLEPEKKLMLAVLEDAVDCYRHYASARDRKGQNLFQDAEDWILGDNSEWLFSFENICESLGLSPRYIRRGLIGLRDKAIAECAQQEAPGRKPKKPSRSRYLRPSTRGRHEKPSVKAA